MERRPISNPQQRIELLKQSEEFLRALLKFPYSIEGATFLDRHTRIAALRRHESLSRAADELTALIEVSHSPRVVSIDEEKLAEDIIERCIKMVEIRAAELDLPKIEAKINSGRARLAANKGHGPNREKKAKVIEAFLSRKFSSKSAAAVKLASEFGVSHRTIERWLAKLSKSTHC